LWAISNIEEKRLDVIEMSKSKRCRRVAPANEKEATIRDEDWKEMCKDCEILRLYNDCTFGCEFVKNVLKKSSKKKR